MNVVPQNVNTYFGTYLTYKHKKGAAKLETRASLQALI